MKKVDYRDFEVTSSKQLKELNTAIDLDADKKEIKKAMKKHRKKLGKWQDVLYAHAKYGVLVCLQGMDTAGKDSLIREVFKSFNSRGVVVHSFKVPTDLERSHDYLWRHYIALPEQGKFSVFNRTHYENVLVARVHPGVVLGENIPGIESESDITDEFWDQRFEEINNFEKHIEANGTIIFKFFLHISKEEQRYRLLRRLRKQNKNWKFSSSDLKERKLWDKYQIYYEDAINRTSKPHAPWYVIPSDDKTTARYLVAKIMQERLSEYKDVQNPEPSLDLKENIEKYMRQLEAEGEQK